MKKQLLFIFILFTCLLVSATAHSKMVSIKREGVNVRSGPGEKYEVKWEYGKGFPLLITSSKGNWYKIKDFESDTGWVYKPLTSSTPHMIVKANKNKDKQINIRSGPGTKFKVVAKAYYGVVFKTVEQKKGWAKVEHDSGTVGWIKRSLLWGF